jgi:hypothetical protein
VLETLLMFQPACTICGPLLNRCVHWLALIQRSCASA